MLVHNGKTYARVSEVIAPFANFEGIDPEVLNRKAALGTRIHKAIEESIQGDLVAVDSNEFGYFQSFEQWRRAMSPTFIETEVRCYCDKKMITGCIDAVVKLEGDSKGVLVDWKTSVSESPTWVLQGHLYHYLLKERGLDIADRVLFVKLDRKGGLPKVFEYKIDTNTLDLCMQSIDKFWAANPEIVASNSL